MKLVSGLFLTALVSTSVLADFELSSPDIRHGEFMGSAQEFNGFGCQGANKAPQLNWQDAPAGTQSFALTVYDPDAPTGSGWWHWQVYDLPAETKQLNADRLPQGVQQGPNDYGQYQFGGACPPQGHGAHRYQFRLHALKVNSLSIPEGASAALIGYMINANSIGVASLDALYRR